MVGLTKFVVAGGVAGLIALGSVSGCVSSGGVGEAEMSSLSSEPMSADALIVRVNGLSCPKCANNVERQLSALAGVERVTMNMATGEARLDLAKSPHPSERAIAEAVNDAGFTFVSVRAAGVADVSG